MSQHVEWLECGRWLGVELLHRGDRVPEEHGAEVTSNLAFALGSDDVVVIEGSREQLAALIARLGALLAGDGKRELPGLGPEFCEEHPGVELENDIDEDGKGVATCPRCQEEES